MMRFDRSEPLARSCRHYSGVLVLARPADLSACVVQLERLAGVEVHHTDSKSGKIIAVLESASLEGQEHLLRRVRTTPHVLLAELVYYRRDDTPNVDAAIVDESEGIGRMEA